MQNRQKHEKQQMAADLPRFIDLFSTAIEIGVPVENAIKTTAQKCPLRCVRRIVADYGRNRIGS